MIDSYEKYRQVAKYAGGYFEEQFLELIKRLESAEKERDNANAAAIGVALRADALQAEIDNIKEVQFDLKVSAVAEGWRGKCERLEKEREALRDRIEVTDEVVRDLEKKLSTSMWRALREENEALRAETKNLREGLKRMCLDEDANAKEANVLRAKIEQMERQEPAGYGVRYVEPTNGEEDWDSIWKYRVFAEDHIKDFTQAYVDIGEPVGAITVVPLYALPGAQTQGDEK